MLLKGKVGVRSALKAKRGVLGSSMAMRGEEVGELGAKIFCGAGRRLASTGCGSGYEERLNSLKGEIPGLSSVTSFAPSASCKNMLLAVCFGNSPAPAETACWFVAPAREGKLRDCDGSS